MHLLTNLKIGRKLLAAFGCIVVVMLASSALLYERLAFIEQSTGWAVHTHDVLDQLNGMVTAMVNQETGVRGYLVSGDDKFLDPYRGGKLDFQKAFDRARPLTADNPAQQQRLVDVTTLADAWRQDVAEKEIALMSKPDGRDQARAMESSGTGKAHMDGIRGKITEMIGTETALSVTRDAAQAKAFDDSRTTIYVGGGLSVLIAALLCWLLSGIVAGAIVTLTARMSALATGDTATEIPGRSRGDEIGIMARAVQVFKENMIEADRLRGAQEAVKAEAEAEKKAALGKMADEFEAGVKDIVGAVSASSVELQASAQTMSRTAEETATQSGSVAAATEQASSNVQTVAAATEELSGSIAEISRQVTESARICGTAVADAAQARQSMREMEETAQKIDAVVTLINSIAGQTNLLALNATIEAARAGDAGKGFAVVASEVKSLASQTARATEEIAAQIKAVQAASADSVRAIEAISATIGTVDEIAASIASAVEQQGAATQEIARNVQEAAIGTNEVSSSIGGVSMAAAETGSAATQVLGAAGELSQQSERLRGQVDHFLRTIRAA